MLDLFGVTLQLSFQIWTSEMQERQRFKKHGDAAFRAKDFTATIDSHTEVGTFIVMPWKLRHAENHADIRCTDI